MLEWLENGKYVRAAGSGEVYLFHEQVNAKQLILGTTEHIFLVSRNKFTFTKVWSLPFSSHLLCFTFIITLEITGPPQVLENGLTIQVWYHRSAKGPINKVHYILDIAKLLLGYCFSCY